MPFDPVFGLLVSSLPQYSLSRHKNSDIKSNSCFVREGVLPVPSDGWGCPGMELWNHLAALTACPGRGAAGRPLALDLPATQRDSSGRHQPPQLHVCGHHPAWLRPRIADLRTFQCYHLGSICPAGPAAPTGALSVPRGLRRGPGCGVWGVGRPRLSGKTPEIECLGEEEFPLGLNWTVFHSLPDSPSLFTKELHFSGFPHPPPPPPVLLWPLGWVRGKASLGPKVLRAAAKGLAAWAPASFLSRWQKAEGKKIHSNTRARGHLRREIRLLLGETQMESQSWEIDLFAGCPHSPLGSSVTVSSVLIILSSWSTRLAWQRIELRRSFSPAEMYCVHGLFVGDSVVEAAERGGGASSGGWGHQGLPAQPGL